MKRASQAQAHTIQGTLYALTIVGNVWLIALFMDLEFTEPYQVMAILMGAFGFVTLRRFDLLTPWMPGRQGSVGTRMYWTWVGLVGALLLLGYATKYSEYFSRKVLLLWFVSTPVALLALHKLAVAVTGGLLPHAVRRRTCVVVFVNDSARTLTRNLRKSQTYELVGFFEDRDMDRTGGPLEEMPYLGWRVTSRSTCATTASTWSSSCFRMTAGAGHSICWTIWAIPPPRSTTCRIS